MSKVRIPVMSVDTATTLKELILKKRPNTVPTSNILMMIAFSIKFSLFKFIMSIIFDAYTAV